MKNVLAFILVISVSWSLQAQDWMDNTPCGTYSKNKARPSAWYTVDTLGDKLKATERKMKAEWVYSGGWQREESYGLLNAIYERCPAPDNITYYRYRIEKTKGIRQRQDSIITWKYTPPAKTEYDKLVDSLTARREDTLLLKTPGRFYTDTTFVASGLTVYGSWDTTAFIRSQPKDWCREAINLADSLNNELLASGLENIVLRIIARHESELLGMVSKRGKIRDKKAFRQKRKELLALIDAMLIITEARKEDKLPEL